MIKIFKNLLIPILFLFLLNSLYASQYKDLIDKVFSNRKLESLEGIWKKTIANDGPSGCITVFFKTDDNIFNQIHIDSCFIMGEITGKQKKINNNSYEGENAVYFFNGDVNWGASYIEISEKYDSLYISHESYGNVFKEKWERIWPEDINDHNSYLN